MGWSGFACIDDVVRQWTSGYLSFQSWNLIVDCVSVGRPGVPPFRSSRIFLRYWRLVCKEQFDSIELKHFAVTSTKFLVISTILLHLTFSRCVTTK